MALQPEDYDFVSNFSTFWAVFLGAILATVGGFAATQLEWYFERKRREQHAALFFGEMLTTLKYIIEFAKSTKAVGDPYGMVTIRLFRSAYSEIDLYNRNRENLYSLRDAMLRARIHTLVLRMGSPMEGLFDTTEAIHAAQLRLKDPKIAKEERDELEAKIANLTRAREGGYEFLMENVEQIPALLAALEPLAKHNFSAIEAAARAN